MNLVNEIFEPALQDQIKKEHISLAPVRTDKGFSGVSALYHFNNIEKNASIPVYYAAVAKSVIRMLNNNTLEVSDKDGSKPNKNSNKEIVKMRPLRPGDISVLCKTNEAVEQISGELLSRGVRVAAEINGLDQKAEYKLVNTLLRLIISQNDSLAKAEIKVLTESNLSIGGLIDERLEFIENLPDFLFVGGFATIHSYFRVLSLSCFRDKFLFPTAHNET